MHSSNTSEVSSSLAQLAEKVLPMVPVAGKFNTAIAGLSLTRWDASEQTDTCFYAPSIGIILQGHKQSRIGSEFFSYGAGDYLVNGVHMPSASKIIAASPENPLLALSLVIDKQLATELAAEIPPVAASPIHQHIGVSVAKVPADILDAFARLVDTLDKPEQMPLLAPLLIREIIVRVLMGPQGDTLRMIYSSGSHSSQIAQAIGWLHANYTQTLHIDALAAQVGMANSTFHRQFKNVTSISPLQFQKCLRLYEAQRLMLVTDMDANNAARAVGYDNVQQFNREYKRLFGDPPHRHVRKIQQA